MIKKLKYASFFLILSLLGCWEGNSDKDKLIVGLSADYPPFEFFKSDQIIGFDVDLVKKIGEEMKKHIEIKEMPFPNLIPALQDGSIDMVISALSITDERKELVDFSDIYYKSNMAIVFKPSLIKISSIDSMKGKKIGVQVGTTMESFLVDNEQLLTGITVITKNSNIDLIKSLNANLIDVLVIDLEQGVEFTKIYPNLQCVEVKHDDNYGFAIAFKHDSSLVQPINQVLKTLQDTGWIEQLKTTWKLIWDKTIEELGLSGSENAAESDINHENSSSTSTDQKTIDSSEMAAFEESADETESTSPFVGDSTNATGNVSGSEQKPENDIGEKSENSDKTSNASSETANTTSESSNDSTTDSSQNNDKQDASSSTNGPNDSGNATNNENLSFNIN